MRKPNTESITMPSLSSLQGLGSTVKGVSDDKNVVQMALDRLIPFKDHPYKDGGEKHILKLMDSIRENGVSTPALARPIENGNFELITGHCRKIACERLALTTMPVIVKNITHEEATVLMVDDNLTQRKTILPSEMARAYKMRFEAIKSPGYKKTPNGTALSRMSKELDKSEKSIQRLVKIADLTDGLLAMLDKNVFGLTQAHDLSFLNYGEQHIVELQLEQKKSLDMSQSAKIKELAKKGHINPDSVSEILDEPKLPRPRATRVNQKHIGEGLDANRLVFVPSGVIDNCFPKNTSQDDITRTIVTLLTEWKERGERDGIAI